MARCAPRALLPDPLMPYSPLAAPQPRALPAIPATVRSTASRRPGESPIACSAPPSCFLGDDGGPAPVLPLHDPNQAIAPLPLTAKGDFFPLGTDHKGRDILSRLIWGSQRVLIWATLATAWPTSSAC